MMQKKCISQKVMIIDSNRLVNLLLRLMLTKTGHLVAFFIDYEKALVRLNEPFYLTFPPDVLILSLAMKQRETVRILAAFVHLPPYKNTRVVVMVDKEEGIHRDVQRLIEIRHAQVLEKPVRVQDVISVVDVPMSKSSQPVV